MISEERLREAAKEAAMALADSLPEPENCPDFVPSEFEPRIPQAMPVRASWHRWSALKGVACFLAALCLSGAVLLGTNAQAQEAFFGWVNTLRDNVSHYFFDGPDATETTGVAYSLGEIPEGYWPSPGEEVIGTDTWTEKLYENADGLLLAFGYLERETVNSVTELFFDVGDTPKTTVLVHGKPADCYWDQTNETGSVIVWQDEETDVLLYISGFFSEKELIAMAEQVVREGD